MGAPSGAPAPGATAGGAGSGRQAGLGPPLGARSVGGPGPSRAPPWGATADARAIFAMQRDHNIHVSWSRDSPLYRMWQARRKQHTLLGALSRLSQAVAEHRWVQARARTHTQAGQRSEVRLLTRPALAAVTAMRTAVTAVEEAAKMPGEVFLPFPFSPSALTVESLQRSGALLPWEDGSWVAHVRCDARALWLSRAQQAVAKAECAAHEGSYLAPEAATALSYFEHHVRSACTLLTQIDAGAAPLPCSSQQVELRGGQRAEYIEGWRQAVASIGNAYASMRDAASAVWVKAGLVMAQQPLSPQQMGAPEDGEGGSGGVSSDSLSSWDGDAGRGEEDAHESQPEADLETLFL